MKNLKRILMLLLALSMVLCCLFACDEGTPPACQHEDEDEDGVCDLCEAVLEEPEGDGITLIEDETFLFRIVLGSDITSGTRMVVDDFADLIEEFGIELEITEDTKDGEEWDLEVLVGTVKSRGDEYEYYKYDLGYEGYAITPFDETKIAVVGGSDEALTNAFTMFIEDYLGITEDTEYIENVTIYEDDWVVEEYDKYRVTSVSVGDTEINGYVIARNKAVPDHTAAALKLQSFFYEKAGYWLEIVNLEDAGDKAIVITAVEKGKAGSNGFRTRTDGDTLYIECAHKSKFEEAFNEYYNKTFVSAKNDLVLDKYDAITDITRVYYSDFGAKGDGKTDDSEAIRRAHAAANEGNQTVMSEAGKTYYIGRVNPSIPIRTDVNWNNAKFIFDDSDFTNADSVSVFEIESDYENFYYNSTDYQIIELNEARGEDGLVIKGINHGDEQTTKLDLGLGYPAMLTVYNKYANTYLRYGYVDSTGSDQHEVIVVDEDGNIDPTTPFLLDYTEVTSIRIHRIDVTPITIKNATVTSIASRVNLLGGYKSISRGIAITRPNTTVENLIHVIEGEIDNKAPAMQDPLTGLWTDVSNQGFEIKNGVVYKDGKKYTGPENIQPFTGHSYGGFISISNTHNTLIKKVTFQARVYYEEGTYDISCGNANKIVFEDCDQSNFFDESERYTKYNGGVSTFPNMARCWGIAGTNYCKNMDYINCSLTRYDAHCGVLNGKIIGGKISVLRLIGGGSFVLDGVTIYHRSGAPLQLREDYGATFNGTLEIRNCIIKDGWYSQNGKYGTISALIDAPTANWDNGYPTYFPNVIIDNLVVETNQTELPIVTVGGETYTKEKNHFPSRSIVKENVHDPDALFTVYYETADPDIVTKKPELFPYLEGKKLGKDYEIVNNGNDTYTLIAKNIPNLQPYNPPEFIEIVNMTNFKNLEGKTIKLTLYKANFFSETEIKDEDGVLVRTNVPK